MWKSFLRSFKDIFSWKTFVWHRELRRRGREYKKEKLFLVNSLRHDADKNQVGKILDMTLRNIVSEEIETARDTLVKENTKEINSKKHIIGFKSWREKNMITYFPKNPSCEICNITNLSTERTDQEVDRRTLVSLRRLELETMSCLQSFLPPSLKLERICTDNSKEFVKACQNSQWTHDTSVSHHS